MCKGPEPGETTTSLLIFNYGMNLASDDAAFEEEQEEN